MNKSNKLQEILYHQLESKNYTKNKTRTRFFVFKINKSPVAIYNNKNYLLEHRIEATKRNERFNRMVRKFYTIEFNR